MEAFYVLGILSCRTIFDVKITMSNTMIVLLTAEVNIGKYWLLISGDGEKYCPTHYQGVSLLCTHVVLYGWSHDKRTLIHCT